MDLYLFSIGALHIRIIYLKKICWYTAKSKIKLFDFNFKNFLVWVQYKIWFKDFKRW